MPSSIGTTIGLLVALSILAVPPVAACSCMQPQHWGFLVPESGRVPANAVGVAWHRPAGSRSFSLILAQVSVEEKQRDGTFEQVPAMVEAVSGFDGVFVIGPRAGLRVGATYRFTDRGERRGKVPEQVLVTVDAALLEATTPLFLRIWPLYSETIRVVDGGSCSAPLWVAQVLTEARLPDLLQGWGHQLLYRTLVGDRTWRPKRGACQHIPPGRSWRDTTAEDLLYSACPAPTGETGKHRSYQGRSRDRGLEPTEHVVKVQAFLPGTDVVLETEALTADLGCPGHLER